VPFSIEESFVCGVFYVNGNRPANLLLGKRADNALPLHRHPDDSQATALVLSPNFGERCCFRFEIAAVGLDKSDDDEVPFTGLDWQGVVDIEPFRSFDVHVPSAGKGVCTYRCGESSDGHHLFFTQRGKLNIWSKGRLC
jgi:hypothetical protein